VRPSLLDGEGGYGAKWIRRVAHWPIVFLPADAKGKIAALDVAELGEAIANLSATHIASECNRSAREFDLGGPKTESLGDVIADIRRLHTNQPATQLRVPALLARIASHVCDALHVTPYSFGHYQLLHYDNCPMWNRLPELLGRTPKAVGISKDTINLPQTTLALLS
jgi:hypothetical protein